MIDVRVVPTTSAGLKDWSVGGFIKVFERHLIIEQQVCGRRMLFTKYSADPPEAFDLIIKDGDSYGSPEYYIRFYNERDAHVVLGLQLQDCDFCLMGSVVK